MSGSKTQSYFPSLLCCRFIKLLDKCVTAKEEMEKDLFEKVCDECID